MAVLLDVLVSVSPEQLPGKVREWIRSHLTLPVAELWTTVNQKLAGHYAYYHVSDNWTGVQQFRWQTVKTLY